MIGFDDACSLALRFYKEKLHLVGLAQAYESEKVYIFSGRTAGKCNIGGCTICVDKESGDISVLRFPSKESSLLIRNAKTVDLPASLAEGNA